MGLGLLHRFSCIIEPIVATNPSRHECMRRSSATATLEQCSSDLDVLKSDETGEQGEMASVSTGSSLAGGL
jgi:hypothetical protein